MADTQCDIGWLRPSDMLLLEKAGILQLRRHGQMRHQWRNKQRWVGKALLTCTEHQLL
jgi:hypothetical protein